MKQIIIIFLWAFLFSCSNWKSVEYFDAKFFKSSNVKIDCRVDTDCYLERLATPCWWFTSININNKRADIDEFNKTEKKRLENYVFDCTLPLTKEQITPKCVNNMCTYIEK